MTDAVIHIGAGKCGSSALQTALAHNPVVGKALNGSMKFVAIRPKGMLLSGDKLVKSAASNPLGYCPTINAKAITSLSLFQRSALSNNLSKVSRDAGGIILSSESWLHDAELFNDSRLLLVLKLNCTLVCYIRPPVEWINSAWWQWGAWTGAPFKRWLNRALPRVCWYDKLLKWKDVAGVEKITVRLLPKDIVSDFCGIIGVTPIKTIHSNTSLPESILRLYQRQNQLRSTAHDSEIDFVLARRLDGLGGSTPWVLGSQAIERIIDVTKESNLGLLDLIDRDSRSEMADDPRWWSSEAFSHRQKEPPINKKNINVDELDDLAAKALQVICELDEENRALRQKLDV